MRLVCDRSLAEALPADLLSQVAVVDRPRGADGRWQRVHADVAIEQLSLPAADLVVVRPESHDRGVDDLVAVARLGGHHIVRLWGAGSPAHGAHLVGIIALCRRDGCAGGAQLLQVAQVVAGLPDAVIDGWRGRPERGARWARRAWRACPRCVPGGGPLGGACAGCGAAIGGGR